eukprot:TRINITY_DN38013_c0_g1_i1.p1 TRINITY_DN38013_c0_g1~~TRINITY_DN38013_c0_g1_i1.p1  ORF type:complete len:365 (-),score=52.06 TRINITY_DN38013_c0_g1_i1:215-1243(-)
MAAVEAETDNLSDFSLGAAEDEVCLDVDVVAVKDGEEPGDDKDEENELDAWWEEFAENKDTEPMLSPRRPYPELDVSKFKPQPPDPKQEAIELKQTLDAVDPDPWVRGAGGTQSEDMPSETRYFLFDLFYKSQDIRLSPDLTTATFRHRPFGGWVLAQNKLHKKPHGRWFEVRIEEQANSRWSDGLGIGFARHPEGDPRVTSDKGAFKGFAYETIPECWMIGYDGRAILKGIKRIIKGSEVRNLNVGIDMWKPSELRCGDMVAVLATPEGHLLLFVNRVLRYYVRFCGVPWNVHVHPIIDLDGCTITVHLTDSLEPCNDVLMQLSELKAEDTCFRDYTPADI